MALPLTFFFKTSESHPVQLLFLKGLRQRAFSNKHQLLLPWSTTTQAKYLPVWLQWPVINMLCNNKHLPNKRSHTPYCSHPARGRPFLSRPLSCSPSSRKRLTSQSFRRLSVLIQPSKASPRRQRYHRWHRWLRKRLPVDNKIFNVTAIHHRRHLLHCTLALPLQTSPLAMFPVQCLQTRLQQRPLLPECHHLRTLPSISKWWQPTLPNSSRRCL